MLLIGFSLVFRVKKLLSRVGFRGAGLFAPCGTVLDDPVEQGAFVTDVCATLLAFEPFVPQDFLALGEKRAVKRRVFHEVGSVFQWLWLLFHIGAFTIYLISGESQLFCEILAQSKKTRI